MRADLRARVLGFLFFSWRGIATMAVVGAPVLVLTAPISVPVIGVAIGIDKLNAWRNR